MVVLGSSTPKGPIQKHPKRTVATSTKHSDARPLSGAATRFHMHPIDMFVTFRGMEDLPDLKASAPPPTCQELSSLGPFFGGFFMLSRIDLGHDHSDRMPHLASFQASSARSTAKRPDRGNDRGWVAHRVAARQKRIKHEGSNPGRPTGSELHRDRPPP